MQQKSSACVFHIHKTLDRSEYLCTSYEIADVHHVIGLQTGKCADGIAATSPPLPSPNALPVCGAISMTASYAEYTPCTRCHMVEGLRKEQLGSYWPRSVLLSAGWIFDASCSSLRRGALVMGVFLIRNTEVEFTVGLITHSMSGSQRLQSILSVFCDTHKLSKFYAELPLCSAHRATTVRMWWEPRSERVTPHRVMPLMKVIVVQDHSELRGQRDEAQIFVYAAANIFLCRPVASRLRGTTRKLLKCSEMCFTEKSTHPVLAKSRNRPSEVAFSAVFAPVSESRGAARSKGRSQPPQADRWQTTSVLCFDDLSAVEVGEHLVGVEVEVLPAYRAFVPLLYGHIAPFLVVAEEDA